MSTVLANPTKMVRQGAPRLIRTDEELAIYTDALFDLTAKDNPSPDEEEAIELLTLLIDRYESQSFPVPDAKPADVLRFLLERNGLSQRDIAPEVGSESTVSLVLSGKRSLTFDHVARLSRRFHVSPAVFFTSNSPKREKHDVANDELIIERRANGTYAVRRSHSKRASAILSTKAEAIERAKAMNSNASVHVETVRGTDAGSKDNWRRR